MFKKILNLPISVSHLIKDLLRPLKSRHLTLNEKILAVCFLLPLNKFHHLVKKTKINRALFLFLPKLGNFNQHIPQTISLYVNESHNYTSATPIIAICTPSLNHAKFLNRTIDSVLSQKYSNLQYIIKDGGSKDSTTEILKRHNDQLWHWESTDDNGQAAALNSGFSHAVAPDIMAYLNSDDLLLPDCINTVITFFNANPNVDVIYGNRLLIDENDQCIGEWVMPAHDSTVLSYADYIPQESLFWRASIWEKVGGKFDESFLFALDWDLILRFRNAGATFAHIPHYLAAFRIHEQQKTSSLINSIGAREMTLLRRRELGYIPENFEIFIKVFPFLIKHVLVDMKLRYANKSS